MKKTITFIILIVIIYSCSNNNQMDKEYMNKVGISDNIPTFCLKEQSVFDTISFFNIIDTVTYIQLETNKNAILGEIFLSVLKIKNKYIVKSGTLGSPVVKSFGSKGEYLENVFTLGRGPGELSNLIEWIANDDKVCMFSFDRVLIYDLSSKKSHTIRLPHIDGISFTKWCCISKNMYVTTNVLPYLPEYNKNEMPYLISMDSIFRIKKKLYYPTPRKIFQDPIPDITLATESWVLSSNGTEPLFIDVFNDTVYRIDTNETLYPKYVLKRNKEQMPKVEETNAKQSVVANKIHFTKILEGEDYICLNTINGAGNTGFYMWHKSSEKPICANSICRIPVSFDGFHGEITIDQIIGNTLITAIPANKLMNVLPGLKEDDNPVVVEIKLKDNYTPAQ